jgi:hypothetical protein
MKWIRVTRNRKCPICDHSDWCGVSEDGHAAICMRVPSDHPTRNEGHLHKLFDPIPIYVAPKPRIEAAPDLNSLWNRWSLETDYHFLDGFAMTLGVDSAALQAIGCAWNGSAWGFPMRDATKRMIGIRLRGSDGKKWAVAGSHQGLFIPASYPYCIDDGTLYITEGPTDLAAAMTLGLYSIGRPSCLGQEEMILAYLRNMKVRRVVIVTDNDMPGLNGARKLQSQLQIRSCIYIPPAKDIREFAAFGGDANLIESSIRDLVWKAA